MTYVADYIKAKVKVNFLGRKFWRALQKVERQYIKKHNIINFDGSVSSCVADIDNDDIRLAANVAIQRRANNIEYSQEIKEAYNIMWRIKDNLTKK